jgi:hypothetical protein
MFAAIRAAQPSANEAMPASAPLDDHSGAGSKASSQESRSRSNPQLNSPIFQSWLFVVGQGSDVISKPPMPAPSSVDPNTVRVGTSLPSTIKATPAMLTLHRR